ncbi:MAG: hypothetical protein GY705_31510 [Bacteroidetes bacterium]|nr:hypothetical protein [Bacteroidota bacterium]
MLDLQLTRVTEGFVNDPRSNYFQNGTLYVSKIFKWFHEDFNNNITSFIVKYAKGELKKNLSSHSGDIQIKYLNYDWSINRR